MPGRCPVLQKVDQTFGSQLSRISEVRVGAPRRVKGKAGTRRWVRTRSQRLVIYFDSSERLNDLMVRARSLLASSAATGFINRIKPKRSPSAT